jgi:AraC family transcriptional regulator, transcriptional activator of pobA
MSRRLPRYSICTLSDASHSGNDFIADHLGNYIEEHKDLKFPHKHSFYHIVYFAKGNGSHSIDFVRFTVKPGQVYFMIPEQVHTWEFEGHVDGYIINFTDEFLYELVNNPRYLDQFSFLSGDAMQQVIQLPASAQPAFTELCERIISEQQSANPLKDDFIRTALLQLLIVTSRCCSTETTKANPYNSVLLSNFKRLIDLHYKDKKLTKQYAALLYVTPNHLNALTKDATGRSAGELIRNRIILEAKRLLVNANMTIGEIATELEFIDNSYFSKFFKKYEGITPEAFRKQFQSN